jgi:multicomponent Na+:H+ antiporter subunit E
MSHQSSSKMTVSIVRFILFLGVWLMIADWKKEDFPIGFVASARALWISLSLLPPTTIRPHFIPLARLNLRFLSSSIIAGVDVARRALLPRLDLRPGFVAVPFALPPRRHP